MDRETFFITFSEDDFYGKTLTTYPKVLELENPEPLSIVIAEALSWKRDLSRHRDDDVIADMLESSYSETLVEPLRNHVVEILNRLDYVIPELKENQELDYGSVEHMDSNGLVHLFFTRIT